MYGLNIHLHSFHLDNSIIGQNDKIRVSITTIPEDNKQAFIMDAKMMNRIHHFFTLNMRSYTEKIIFVFRKKSFIQNDPIIASSIIHTNEFPKSKDDTSNNQLKNFNIYEPISRIEDRKDQFKCANRRIIGQMVLEFSVEEVFPTVNYNTKYQSSKTLNGQGYSKIKSNENNENQNNNNIVFIDNGC